MLNELAKKVHQNAVDKGFYDDGKASNMGERLALIHSEVSEALEADRKGKYCTANMSVINGWTDNNDFKKSYTENVKGTFEEEMADIVIRVLDTCGEKCIDLDGHIKAKMRFNSLRERMHGKKY